MDIFPTFFHGGATVVCWLAIRELRLLPIESYLWSQLGASSMVLTFEFAFI